MICTLTFSHFIESYDSQSNPTIQSLTPAYRSKVGSVLLDPEVKRGVDHGLQACSVQLSFLTLLNSQKLIDPVETEALQKHFKIETNRYTKNFAE